MVTNYQGLPVTWSDVLVLITAYLGTRRHSRGASGTGRNRGYATHNLLAVGIWNDYRVVVERPAPRHHAVEKIRVGEADVLDSAPPLDLGDSVIIDQAHAVVQDVSAVGLHQQTALSDGERWLNADSQRSWFLLAQNVSVAVGLQTFHRNPLLALSRHGLPWVEADRAFSRRGFGLGVLHSASLADVVSQCSSLGIRARIRLSDMSRGVKRF